MSFTQIGPDINGEAADDRSGQSVSLSSDGSVLAIGANGNDANGSAAGHTRIYAWNGTAWVQRGSDIDGQTTNDQAGVAVSLSSDGSVVAVGAFGHDSYRGTTRIYAWNGSAWVQRGSDIDGEAAKDNLGHYDGVSLSDDGTVVAISSWVGVGRVRVYQWNGSSWNKLGSDLDGEAALDNFGNGVSISGDGTTVAVGAHLNDGNGSNSAHTRIYRWNGTAWDQLGNDFGGEAEHAKLTTRIHACMLHTTRIHT